MIAILWTSPIQVDEVDTNMLFSICLLHHDHIRHPFLISGFSDESHVEQFVYLLGYHLLPLECKASLLLLERPILWINIQSVHHHRWVDVE